MTWVSPKIHGYRWIAKELTVSWTMSCFESVALTRLDVGSDVKRSWCLAKVVHGIAMGSVKGEGGQD